MKFCCLILLAAASAVVLMKHSVLGECLILQQIEQYGQECSKKYRNATGDESLCVIPCIFNKTGAMDKNGTTDIEIFDQKLKECDEPLPDDMQKTVDCFKAKMPEVKASEGCKGYKPLYDCKQ